MVRSFHAIAALVVLAILPGSGQLLVAQTKKKGETISGTVVSIEKAKTGRSYTLKMKTKSDETEYDVPIVPRTQLVITGLGDLGFVKPNANVGGILYQVGQDFACADLNVYLGTPPPPQFKQAEKPGLEGPEFEMSGKVIEAQKGAVQVQCGPQAIKISIDAATTMVNVVGNDATLIKEGDAVEVDGTIIKGKQTINANLITVKISEPMDSNEYFAAQGETKGKSAKTAAGKTKTKKDAGTSSAAGEADPFGVLGNKPKTKTKTSGGAGGLPPAGKDSDPFGVLKNKAKTKAKAGSGADAEMDEPAAGKPGVKKAVKGAKAAKSEEKTESKE